MKNCYVYAYLREADQSPYYIGKGSGKRAYTEHRNVRIPGNKELIVILKDGLTNDEAHELEIKFINQYGRKNNGTGILHNKTDGGEGTSGATLTEHTRKRMSDASKGVSKSTSHRENISKALTGRQRSLDHSANISAALKGRVIPAHTRLNMKAAQTGIQKTVSKIECPHCGKIGNSNIMKRWHFDLCPAKD
jgi:hypothetical protein